METINITPKTKKIFEQERMILIGEEKKLINQDEFLKKLIINWRKK